MKKVHTARELSAAVLIVICSGARLYGITPFGSPMYCALSCGSDRRGMSHGAAAALTAFVSALYIACEYLFTFELIRVYISGAVAVIVLLRQIISLKCPRLDKPYARIAFSMLALVVEAALYGIFAKPTLALASFAVSAVFYYFAVRMSELVHACFSFKLSPVDGAAVCVTLAVFGLAFGRASVGGINVGLALAFLSCAALGTMGQKQLVFGSIAIAIGLAVAADMNTGLAFAAGMLLTSAFLSLPRPVYLCVGIGGVAAFSVLFYVPPAAVGWNALMCAAGAFPVLVLPRRTVKFIREYFDFDGGARLAVRYYVNLIKADAGDRMLRLAAVFDETARLMNAFSETVPDYCALGKALSDKVCPYCPKNGVCPREDADKAFCELAELASGGERIIAELPEFFSRSCRCAPDVASVAAEFADKKRAAEKADECDAKAKAVVTERLAAVHEVLTKLGLNQAQPVGFDGDAEKRIKDELGLCGVECADAFVTRDGVTAVVRSDRAEREKIRKAVSACMKAPYVLTDLERSASFGWSVAMLKKRPMYDAVYARVGVSKSGVSGDSYTFKRIGESVSNVGSGGNAIGDKGAKGEKFLAALVDGMGTGENASACSDAAVRLIECFYRAGFDSESALSGVNKFLKTDGERYSAADIAVCDLSDASVDIIKIGAPPCYIKTRDTVLKIEGSSLPIGVLDEMRPYVTRKRIYPGQMYIAVSDGVGDCFVGDELPSFINGLEPFNPEKTADAILKRALEIVGTPKDDMTVIAFRLFTPTKKSKIKQLGRRHE